MRSTRLWALLLGVENAVVEDVVFEEVNEGAIVVSVRPRKRFRGRCGVCGRRCPGYDQGEGRRRWRALDLGTVKAYLEADSPRVKCRRHGVVVAQVPWARHSAGHTYAFDDTCAWLASHCSKSAVVALLRIAWRTVGSIVARVVADARERTDLFVSLSRIGIDEIAYKRGHKYLTVVVDHDSGRLVWAAPGHNKKTLASFFELLGDEQCQAIRLVSCDGAEWITELVAWRCPAAEVCLDPFHVVKWATAALDDVRREVWNAARRRGQRALARQLKGARFALWKNPEDLTDRQAATLAHIAKTNHRLYRASQRAAPAGFQAQGSGGDGTPRAVAHLGSPVPHRALRQARQVDRRLPAGDRKRSHPRAFERPGRGRKHPAASADPGRLRVPIDGRPDRPRHAQPRWALPTAARASGSRAQAQALPLPLTAALGERNFP